MSMSMSRKSMSRKSMSSRSMIRSMKHEAASGMRYSIRERRERERERCNRERKWYRRIVHGCILWTVHT